MPRQSIATDTAPQPLGAYALAMEGHGLIVVTGQVARNPASMAPLAPGSTGAEEISGDIREQTRRALLNIQAILRAGGSDLGLVLKTTCFLAHSDDFSAFDEVYGQFFPGDPPARSTVAVGLLPPCLVMIEAVAARSTGG